MKLKVIVKPHLKLTKENEIKEYGEVFEVSEERGIEILKTVFNGEAVVEFVPDENSGNEALKAKIIKISEDKDNLSKENEALKAEIEKLNKKNEDKGKGEK